LKENDTWNVTQSVFTVLPNGVRKDSFDITDEKPVFGFKVSLGNNWDTLYMNGQLEFRRLKLLA
jgi:hypothetical protein